MKNSYLSSYFTTFKMFDDGKINEINLANYIGGDDFQMFLAIMFLSFFMCDVPQLK